MRAKTRKKRRVFLTLLLLAALFGLLFWYLERNLTSVVLSLANARARALAVTALNEAADEVIREGITYDELIHVTLDDTGHVQMIQANTREMNLLASRVSLNAQMRLEAIENQYVMVPLGSALGLTLLAGSGPEIRVAIVPVGTVTASLDTEFQSAGINQTRHKVYLTLRGNVRIVIPTGADIVEAVAEVAVAESIIVGDVPDSFADVNNDTDMLNMIP